MAAEFDECDYLEQTTAAAAADGDDGVDRGGHRHQHRDGKERDGEQQQRKPPRVGWRRREGSHGEEARKGGSGGEVEAARGGRFWRHGGRGRWAGSSGPRWHEREEGEAEREREWGSSRDRETREGELQWDPIPRESR